MSIPERCKRALFLGGLAQLAVVAHSGMALAGDPAGAPRSEAPAEQNEPRFRWGISGLGGPIFVRGNVGGGSGVDARVGLQITRSLGLYAQPFLAVTGAKITYSSNSLLSLMGVAAALDWTLADRFYLAVGPEVVRLGEQNTGEELGNAVAAALGAQGTSTPPLDGTFFSVAARTGVAFGSMMPDRRRAFTVGLSVRSMFTTGGATVFPVVALGYESF